MKNKCFKALCMFALTFFVSVLAMICSYADVEQRTQLPNDVQSFFANSRWKEWEITGWVNPKHQKKSSACAFVAVKNGNSNTLVAFGWENGKWVYKWHNPSALPQVAEPIVLGTIISDNVCFTSFYVYDKEIEEMFCVWEQQKNGSWELQELQHFGCYRPKKGLMFFDTHKDGVIQISNAGWVDGKETNTKVYGTYQRNLRYFNLVDFPLSLNDACSALSNSPKIPNEDFQAKNIKLPSNTKYPASAEVSTDEFSTLYRLEPRDLVFPKEKRYAVYSGPGKDYLRGADGKAAVSTNALIQGFASENGWIMIEYEVERNHHRIGWIQENSIQFGHSLSELPASYGSAMLAEGAIITDDPFYSKAPLYNFPMTIEVYVLAKLGDWIYIESSSGDLIRGFVHKSQLTPGKVFDLEQWSHGSTVFNGRVIIDRKRIFVEIEPIIYQNGIPEPIAAIRIYDGITNQLLLSVSESNEKKHLVGSADIPKSTSSLRIVAIDAKMNEIKSEESFVIEW